MKVSYHYVQASDYIKVKNADAVAEFMEQSKFRSLKENLDNGCSL